jgi:hypothetical protein
MISLDGGYAHTVRALRTRLLAAPEVDVGEWHSQKVEGIPQLVTRELRDVTLSFPLPSLATEEMNTETALQHLIEPNLPWAEEHFLERVGGIPLNPPPSAANWPYAQAGHAAHTDEEEKFSHTYPERMWPKFANRERCGESGDWLAPGPIHGIRFHYGDLADVVQLLRRSPYTRQAYLPIWFPEDTGAVHKERVPCSLGYHFLFRDGKLNVTYMIRSCDFVRHFADDVYMAARLCQWICEQLPGGGWLDEVPPIIDLGDLTMHTMSMHIFQGDVVKLEREITQ